MEYDYVDYGSSYVDNSGYMDNRYYVDEIGQKADITDYNRGDYRRVSEGTQETYEEMGAWHYEPTHYGGYNRGYQGR